MIPISTFSVVAHDPGAQSWGIAVQSKFFAVGTIVPWAESGAGVIATQSWGNPAAGRRGLELLRQGLSTDDVLDALTNEDPHREHRQYGIVDKQGRSAAFTGLKCAESAGHLVGEGFACQGNMLAEGVIPAMANAFESSRQSGGELADWMIAAMQSAQMAGGDKRGEQSAAMMVVCANGGYAGGDDRYIDLRVDHHYSPVAELERLLKLWDVYLRKPEFDTFEPCSPELLKLVSAQADLLGHGIGSFEDQLRFLLAKENLTHLYDFETNLMDPRLADLLGGQYP